MKRLVLNLTLVVVALVAVERGAFAQEGLVGPNKADFLLGPSIGIIDGGGTQFRLQFDYGYNIMPLSFGNLYIVLPLALGVGNNVLIVAPQPGLQLDFLLPVGLPIYVYPKAGVEFGLIRYSAGVFGSSSEFLFGFYFGGGVKYVLNGRWNFIFEPFNIEIAPLNGIPKATIGAYNLMFGVGMNF